MEITRNNFVLTFLFFSACTSLWTAVYSQELIGPIPDAPCPGEMVTFICVTRGSPILAWRSEYIGTTQLEHASANSIGHKDHNQNNTVTATLTGREFNDGVIVLTSGLQMRASSAFPTASVTCIDIGSGGENTTSLPVLGMPNVPREMTYMFDKRNVTANECSVYLSWIIPNNTASGDIAYYVVKADGYNLTNPALGNVDKHLTMIAYSVCKCAAHTITIRAVNRCGHNGQSTTIDIDIDIHVLQVNTLPMVMCTDTVTTTEFSMSTDASSGTAIAIGLGVGTVGLTFVIIAVITIVMIAAIYIFYSKHHKMNTQEKGVVKGDEKSEKEN